MRVKHKQKKQVGSPQPLLNTYLQESVWFQKFDDKLFTNLVFQIAFVYHVKFFSINLLPSFTTAARSFSDDDMIRSLIRPIDFFPVLQSRTMGCKSTAVVPKSLSFEFGDRGVASCLIYFINVKKMFTVKK